MLNEEQPMIMLKSDRDKIDALERVGKERLVDKHAWAEVLHCLKHAELEELIGLYEKTRSVHPNLIEHYKTILRSL